MHETRRVCIDSQVALAHSTDVMIGMHGAGMLHVLWLKPGSTVVEIFPKSKRRWGYRNIAHYRDLRYHVVRAGNDGKKESKTIPVKEWRKAFHPIASKTGLGQPVGPEQGGDGGADNPVALIGTTKP